MAFNVEIIYLQTDYRFFVCVLFTNLGGLIVDNHYITAERMLQNAELIFSTKSSYTDMYRWFITCYLCGYVPECYGKLMLSAFFDCKNDELKKLYGHNLKKIFKDVYDLNLIDSACGKYYIDLKLNCQNIFQGQQKWDPERRYCSDRGTWDDQTIANDFITEARKVMSIVYDMKLDGVI